MITDHIYDYDSQVVHDKLRDNGGIKFMYFAAVRKMNNTCIVQCRCCEMVIPPLLYTTSTIICTHAHMQTHLCIHTRVYTHVHAHMHMYTHTSTH